MPYLKNVRADMNQDTTAVVEPPDAELDRLRKENGELRKENAELKKTLRANTFLLNLTAQNNDVVDKVLYV